MAISTEQIKNLETNTVSKELLKENGLCSDYYLKPLMFIEKNLNLHLCCNGAEYKHAVEIAYDEGIAPHDATLEVIVDGILAMVFHDYLEAVGLDIVSYFTYRFNPSTKEFQKRLDRFEELIQSHKKEVI